MSAARDIITFALIEGPQSPPSPPEAVADNILRELARAGINLVTDQEWDERMERTRQENDHAW